MRGALGCLSAKQMQRVHYAQSGTRCRLSAVAIDHAFKSIVADTLHEMHSTKLSSLKRFQSLIIDMRVNKTSNNILK